MIRSNMSLSQVAAAARKDVGRLLQHVKEQHGDLALACPKPGSNGLLLRSGHHQTPKGLQWVYVATAAHGRITVYPMLWYATTKGTCAMQIDADGPAMFYQQHLIGRFLERYLGEGNLLQALRTFHERNHDKLIHRDTYKGDPNAYVAVIDDGYIAGELKVKECVVHWRTFYDDAAGEKRFGHLKASRKWLEVLKKTTFNRIGRRQAPPQVWSRGYTLTLADRPLAA